MAAQCVFKRYEKKYLLDESRYRALLPLLEEHMECDEYGRHTICNIYFDTEDYRLIRTSLEKPIYKEKLRVRSYGIPNSEGKCFVEIKKKYKGVVYKRRVELSVAQARAWLLEGEKPQKYGQIHREIDWFMDFYQPVPKMYIAYDRVALFGKDDPDLRVTFDQDIRWRQEELSLVDGDHGRRLMDSGLHLMEVKIPGAMPLWMARAFDELDIRMTSFSKYGEAYRQMLTTPEVKLLGDVFCA